MPRPFDIPGALPLDAQAGQTFGTLVALMQRLLSEDGCPWDREQTLLSLRRYVLEEACEVIDAIDSGDLAHLCEELGDLALQIVFQAELARRAGAFGPDDVVRGICEKLVRRHPHVFGDVVVDGSQAVVENWEAIKATEKHRRGLLDGVARALPALERARRLSARAAEVGFDWHDGRGSRAKVTEELAELDQALVTGSREAMEHELGDVLFALVNLARHLELDPEDALRKTADKFVGRFAHVEARVKERHGNWPRGVDGRPGRGLSLDELDGYWEEAKRR
ncbi:MAG: nucleoside triphosphate pyrophosphohydrolase [Polyangiaceae bacterium]|nr:nucleoside triphosphate pyrophosphohydrolase [Polyangiaceae bacterium]